MSSVNDNPRIMLCSDDLDFIYAIDLSCPCGNKILGNTRSYIDEAIALDDSSDIIGLVFICNHCKKEYKAVELTSQGFVLQEIAG